MAEKYYVGTVDLDTGEETVPEPFSSERAAVEHAERLAEEFYGGDDVTWFESVGHGDYHVGRIMPDGTRSAPTVRVVVKEEEIDDESAATDPL